MIFMRASVTHVTQRERASDGVDDVTDGALGGVFRVPDESE